MRADTSRRLAVAVVALLTLAAGCQSFGAATDETNSSAQSLFERHQETLREAGSVTIERSSTHRTLTAGTGSSVLLESERTLRVDVESGRRYRLLQSSLTDTSASYRTESGATFRLIGGRVVAGSEEDGTVVRNESLTPYPANESRLQYRGQETVDGVTGTVYVLTDYAALDGPANGPDPDNVTSFRVTYVVDERGYVAYARQSRTVEHGDSETVLTATFRASAVGSTTVERPAWVDDTTATPQRPDTSRNRTASGVQ